jgi:hypothetical protein
MSNTMSVWAGQVRSGDTIVHDGQEFPVVSTVPVLGGSWFNIFIKGHDEPVPFGQAEKVQIKDHYG